MLPRHILKAMRLKQETVGKATMIRLVTYALQKLKVIHLLKESKIRQTGP